MFSGEEPERLRGPQHHGGWFDELAAFKYPEAWDQYQFGLRLGEFPQTIVTTTPKPIKLIKELITQDNVKVVRGSTFDNAANLAESALAQYRPDGILANAQDIDMGGKGVLRPDATVETGALNEEIIDTAEVLESEPASLMADNAIDKQGVKKESPLLGIAQAASIDRSGTATGNKRDSTSMSIPRIGMAERLMRIGGAITGASSQGLSASMAAGAQAYGGLQDEERRRTAESNVYAL